MEKGRRTSDPQDEVRELREKVRELELQLSQKAARNGTSNLTSKFNDSESDEDESLVPVYDVDLSSKTWLVHSRVDGRSEAEILAWLWRDVVGPQQRALYTAICNAEQDRRKNIDSRTFTRPKKRMGRPSLELLESISSLSKPTDATFSWAIDANEAELENMTCSLMETSLINSTYTSGITTPSVTAQQLSFRNKKQKVGSEVEKKTGGLLISDKNSTEDLSLPLTYDNGNNLTANFENVNLPNFEGEMQKSDNPECDDVSAALLESADFSTSLIDSALMDDNLMDTIIIQPKHKLSLSKIHPINRTFTPSPPPEISRKASHELSGSIQAGNDNLNHTFVKEDVESRVNGSLLNTTFPIGAIDGQRVVPALGRPGSTDSGGADDDQLSSASESSHTSTNRLMSVGDVQHIARLQEQSLVISTPIHRRLTRIITHDEISPILPLDCGRSSGSSETQTAGYGSDHSSRSPISSLHSSPAGSPFGSSTVLSRPNQTQILDNKFVHPSNGIMQRKNTYGLIPPRKIKESGLRPPAPVLASTHVSRPTARSGLRPPMIRTRTTGVSGAAGPGGAAVSALPRPAGTGIPRPSSLSRIPPPKVRSSVSQPSRKEWTDECY